MPSLAEQFYEGGLESGLEKGIVQGREHERLQIARRMLRKGINDTLISRCTELTLDEVEHLKCAMD